MSAGGIWFVHCCLSEVGGLIAYVNYSKGESKRIWILNFPFNTLALFWAGTAENIKTNVKPEKLLIEIELAKQKIHKSIKNFEAVRDKRKLL